MSIKGQKISGLSMWEGFILSVFWSPLVSYSLLAYLCTRPIAQNCQDMATESMIVFCLGFAVIFWMAFTLIFNYVEKKANYLVFSLLLFIPLIALSAFTVGRYLGLFIMH
ncbi:MAG: hypothetical protein ACM3IJ_00230 [Candidatus Levyibacteriota bacterium]